MNRVALVLPYYGRLPDYFNCFLRSLEGRNLDVLFVSDLAVSRHPDNFKPIKLSFEECRRLVGVKIESSALLDSPRRLCDFKPMYGKIFEDYLKGYDYWAFGDCDLVYGSALDKMLDECLQSDCDVFSLHEKYCSGPLCLMKNCERVNNLYREADNWLEVCRTPGSRCVAFDELHGEWHEKLKAGTMTIEDCRRKADSFSAVVLRAEGVKLDFQERIEEGALDQGEVVAMHSDGSLTLNGREIPVFHYVGVKMRGYFKVVPSAYDDVCEYEIDDAGFYVTPFQRKFHRLVKSVRKLTAAVRSLRAHGLGRLRWREG